MSDLDVALQEADDLLDKYNQIAQSEIPDTIKEAEHWSLVVEGLDVGLLTEYPGGEDQRKLDRQRLVPLEGVLLVLADMQTDILAQVVTTPRKIIYQVFGGIYLELAHAITEFGPEMVLLFTTSEGGLRVIPLVTTILARCWRLVLSAFALSELAKGIAGGIKQRNDYAKLMRKQALKQRNGRRFRVKRSHRV